MGGPSRQWERNFWEEPSGSFSPSLPRSNPLNTFCTLRLSVVGKLCKSNKNLQMNPARAIAMKKRSKMEVRRQRISLPACRQQHCSGRHHGVLQ